jgi:tagaturonate reductase
LQPAIPFAIDKKVKEDFANRVFERFCNPFIEHQWQSITCSVYFEDENANIPLLQNHFKLNDTVPVHMAAGFAGFLLYMKAIKSEGGKYFGMRNDKLYEIKMTLLNTSSRFGKTIVLIK